MKLRIKDNTIRLRLTQKEVAEFAKKGEIIAYTNFGSNIFTYALKQAESATIFATFQENTITIHLPIEVAKDWTSTDKVSLRKMTYIDAANHLELLIEKDFKCLVERSNEDESDAYPNPLAQKTP